MSLAGRAFVVGLVAASVLASNAMAAPAAQCRPLIADPAGDARTRASALPTRADLDIRAVSLANDNSTLRLTMRVTGLGTPQPSAAIYDVRFSVKGASYAASAYRGLDRTQFTLRSPSMANPLFRMSRGTDVSGTVDEASGSISILVPLALVGWPKSGALVYDVDAQTSESTAFVSIGYSDETDRGFVYALNKSSCGRR